MIKLPELPIQAVMGKRGNLVAINGLDALPIPPLPGPTGENIDLAEMVGEMIAEFSPPTYPEGPVSVGDVWEWEMVIDPMTMAEKAGAPLPPEVKERMGEMAIPFKCTSTLVGFEAIDGIECAKIEAMAPWEIAMPMGPEGAAGMTLRESGSSVVTTWFDYAGGRMVRQTTEVRFTMMLGAGEMVPVRMEMSISGQSELK